jgi:flagellin-like protein
MNNKRGLSPLIATILLVGFAVVVVTLVMVWGTGFVLEIQEKEGTLAQGRLTCVADVRINVLSIEKIDFTTIDVNVVNIGARIDGFVFRITGDVGTEVVTVNQGVEQAETKSVEVVFDSVESGDLLNGAVEVIPRIKLGNGVYESCSDQLVRYNLN